VFQHFAFVSIGVDYFQVLAMFGNAKVSWPPAIVQLFRLMSSLSFNIDITAPECSMPNLSFSAKWCVAVTSPVVVVVVVAAAAAVALPPPT
jgi:hypothetical protein